MAVYQSLTLTQIGQDPIANTSQVRILWQSTQTGGSFNETQRNARYTLWVGEEAVKTATVAYTLPMQQTVVIADETVTVSHNEKGQASITVTTWMDTHISAGIVELRKTLELEKIPQRSLIRAGDGLIGGTARISVTKRDARYGHSIRYAFGSLQGYVGENGNLTDSEEIFLRDSVDMQLPEAFYGEMPDDVRGQCRLWLQTYDGSEPVGAPDEDFIGVMVVDALCYPQVTGTVTDENPLTVSLTGDPCVMVRFASRALCTMQAQGQKGAWITEKRIQGTAVSEDSLVIPFMEQNAVSFYAVDSRGYSREYVHPVSLIPYVKLSAEASVQRINAGEQAVISLSGDCYGGSFGAAENSVTAQVKVEGRDPVTAELTLEKNRYSGQLTLTDLELSQLYQITVSVSDRVMQVEKRLTLKKAVPVFDWGEGDFAFHVPVRMDCPLSLENGGTGSNTPSQAAENLGLLPPMLLDVEYIAPVKWNGLPVYTKLLDFGEMPSFAAKAVAHHTGAERILSCRGSTSQGKTLPYGGLHIYRMDLFCDRENVYIDTELDCAGITAVVQIFYIK